MSYTMENREGELSGRGMSGGTCLGEYVHHFAPQFWTLSGGQYSDLPAAPRSASNL